MHFTLDISLGQLSIVATIIGAILYLHRTFNGINLIIWQHRVMWDHHRRFHTIPEFPTVEPKTK